MGLINWSKKLSVMVSFRILFGVFVCFGGWVRWGRGVLELLGAGWLKKLTMRRLKLQTRARD